MNDAVSTHKPSEKMLEFARNIAARAGVQLPAEVLVSFEACSQFIDEHRAAATAPTERQLNFANAIAKRRGVQIPSSALRDGRELSRWIDANK